MQQRSGTSESSSRSNITSHGGGGASLLKTLKPTENQTDGEVRQSVTTTTQTHTNRHAHRASHNWFRRAEAVEFQQ